MFGLFKKKSMSDLEKHKLMLEEKIKAQSLKASEVAKRNQMFQEIEKRKLALKKLKHIKEENDFSKLKKKTSPVIRGLEKKIAKAAPKVFAAAGKIGEGAAKASMPNTMKEMNRSGSYPSMNKKKGGSKKQSVSFW